MQPEMRAGFENFEKHQRSQNKPAASQRTLTVCGSCGTQRLTSHVT